MGVILKLKYGGRTLDLSSKVEADLRPPTASDVERGWSFGVVLDSSQEAELTRQINDVQWFLDQAGVDPENPVHVLYKPNDTIDFEPYFGQFERYHRYTLAERERDRENTITPSRQFVNAGLNSQIPGHVLNLRIEPYSEGVVQPLGTAKGGVYPDWLVTADRKERGLALAESATNSFTNPVFSAGTWNTGWTAATDCTAVEETRKDFIVYGTASARITADGTVAQFTQSINLTVSTTFVISFMARLDDPNTAVSATHITVFYNGATVSSTYTDMGNGWYLVSASVTGTGSATTTGCEPKNGYTVYVDMFQVTQHSYAQFPFMGDIPTASWSGSAHASTSTRNDYLVSWDWDQVINDGEYSLCFVWKAFSASTDLSANITMMAGDSNNVRLFWDQSVTKWKFTDGTNTLTQSDTSTWSAGDVIVIHITASTGNGLAMYIDGSSKATNGTYTLTGGQSTFYLGSRTDGSTPTSGTYMGFHTFPQELTAAQVLYEYNQINALTTDDQRVEGIPVLWTKDGDDAVDLFDDADRDNWALAFGVDGSARARTYWQLNANNSGSTESDIYFGNTFFEPHRPQINSHTDKVGTAEAAAHNDSGDAHEEVTTGNDSKGTAGDKAKGSLVNPVSYYFIRLKSSSGTNTATFWPYLQVGTSWSRGQSVTMSVSTTYQWFFGGQMSYYPTNLSRFETPLVTWGYEVDSSGSTLSVDEVQIVHGDIVHISNELANTPGRTTTGTTYFVSGKVGRMGSSDYNVTVIGDGEGVHLRPWMGNMLIIVPTRAITDASTYAGSINAGGAKGTKIIPRFRIL